MQRAMNMSYKSVSSIVGVIEVFEPFAVVKDGETLADTPPGEAFANQQAANTLLHHLQCINQPCDAKPINK